eukprot:15178255-Heterocapsa_arctica.AAC.1
MDDVVPDEALQMPRALRGASRAHPAISRKPDSSSIPGFMLKSPSTMKGLSLMTKESAQLLQDLEVLQPKLKSSHQ